MISNRCTRGAALLAATAATAAMTAMGVASCRQRGAQPAGGTPPAESSAATATSPTSPTPQTSPMPPAKSPVPSTPVDQPCSGDVCVTGTMRHMGIEGGFWAIRGDDGVTYDPIGSLAEEFKHEGLRVRLDARARRDMSGIHMAGPLVEIISIRKLDVR